MIALPASPAAFRHAGGDDEDGCTACQDDEAFEQRAVESSATTGCTEPEPDPEDPAVCRHCSHTVEPVPASLPCSGCESTPCVCAP